MPEIEEHLVASKNTRPTGKKIDTAVFHWISAKNLPGFEDDPYNIKAILQMFSEGVAWAGEKHHFSCHWVYDRNGIIYRLVDVKDRAWHAGKSIGAFPAIRDDWNDFSIGHELVGKAGDEFTEAQYKALAWRCRQDEIYVLENHLGKIKTYVGHDWISGEIAVRLKIKKRSVRKVDPGPLFDYQKFYQYLAEERIKEKEVPDVKPTANQFTRGQLIIALFKKFIGG